ncbi:unannotated protein [freshwater metagenome]|uniref:Unannotated protein n=1 Tax=freshwater metagenome TaxID=449393 RepID=A0A6J7TF48_9ZZZZ
MRDAIAVSIIAEAVEITEAAVWISGAVEVMESNASEYWPESTHP